MRPEDRIRAGRDAVRRLPPARAGGAPGDDAAPRGGHRGRVREWRRPSALRRDRPHPADRDRGREPRPGQGIVHNNSSPGDCSTRVRRRDRAAGQGRADRARDQTARRPAGRASSGSARRWPSWSTSTAARPASSPSRTSSRRSSGRSRTKPIPRVAALRRLANGDWFVRGHVAVGDLADYGWSCPSTPTPTTRSAGTSSTSSGCLRRGDTISVNGFSIRVESVRENRIEAVRISLPSGPPP